MTDHEQEPKPTVFQPVELARSIGQRLVSKVLESSVVSETVDILIGMYHEDEYLRKTQRRIDKK